MSPRSPLGVIDSHCHLQTLGQEERERALDRARERGVRGFLIPAIRLAEAEDLLAMCEANADVWCALGVHPHEASSWQPGDEVRLASLLDHEKAVAVGECGLDFHYDHAPRDVQERVMIAQWELALDRSLPVVIHNRSSNEAMLRVFSQDRFADLQTDFHSYSGGRAMAEVLVGRRAYLGFTGMVTFKRADNVREIVPLVPADRLLVETDTPYLAPVPYRGGTNQPAYVVEVLEAVAAELGWTVAETARRTSENFYRLFSKARPTAVS